MGTPWEPHGRMGAEGPTLSIIWVLSLAIFALRQIRFWAKKWPLAISVAAWLLYVALVYLRYLRYLRTVP